MMTRSLYSFTLDNIPVLLASTTYFSIVLAYS